MQTRILGCILVAALAVAFSGCAAISGLGVEKDSPGRQVLLSDVSTPAHATIERLIATGEIKKLEKEEAGGKVVYVVEARVGEKDVEYDVASDGTVLMVEESVAYALLPEAVQAAARKYFGSATELKASKEVEKVENGKTFYEVEGSKGKAVVTLKLTDAGRIIEKEKS